MFFTVIGLQMLQFKMYKLNTYVDAVSTYFVFLVSINCATLFLPFPLLSICEYTSC